ncbi:MAG: endo-1,4-beta-xylanase [Polyangiaceae bacterium]|nr:endo-1,4-beta-xylanase [Polyangiaceae bacterium]
MSVLNRLARPSSLRLLQRLQKTAILAATIALACQHSGPSSPGIHVNTNGAAARLTLQAQHAAERPTPKRQKPQPWKDLASLGKKEEIFFSLGVATKADQLSSDSSLIEYHFRRLTPENAMKWGELEKKPGQYDWQRADQIANFARKHHLKLTGHTLIWHRQTPTWLFQDLQPEDPKSIRLLRERMREHIEKMVHRYSDVVDHWDVVNEAISDDPKRIYRDAGEGSRYYQIFGSGEYIYWAFRYTYDALEAQKKGSAADALYYNDYNVNLKSERILDVLTKIRSTGIPIAGIGLQGHYRLDWPSITEIQTTLDAIRKGGFRAKISELDISVYNDYPQGKFSPAPEVEWSEKLAIYQARRYQEIFKLLEENASLISSVTIWGIRDNESWLNQEPVAGRKNYPLLFNHKSQAKLAAQALLREYN